MLLCGAGCFFLPTMGIELSSGALLSLPPIPVLIGGEAILEVDGAIYSFEFSLNLFALLSVQLLLLSALASGFSNGSKKNKILSLSFGVAGMVGFCLQRVFLAFASPSVGSAGVVYSGFFALGLSLIAVGLALVLFGLCHQSVHHNR